MGIPVKWRIFFFFFYHLHLSGEEVGTEAGKRRAACPQATGSGRRQRAMLVEAACAAWPGRREAEGRPWLFSEFKNSTRALTHCWKTHTHVKRILNLVGLTWEVECFISRRALQESAEEGQPDSLATDAFGNGALRRPPFLGAF